MKDLEVKARNLVLTHNARQILQVFINTFLSLYFLKITDGNVLKVVLYYIIYYFGHIVFFYLIYKFVKIPDIISYRISLFVKLIDCLILLLLGKNIVKIIYLIAILESLAQALYYTSYKTMVVANNKNASFKNYFSTSLAIEGIISLLVPASMGTLINKIGYTYIFAILSFIMGISFLLSFSVETSGKFNKDFQLKTFFSSIKDKNAFSKMIKNSVCYGLTDGGTASLLLSLVIYVNYSKETTLGYLTSAVALTSICLSYFHKKKVNKDNFLNTYLPVAILTIIVTIPVSIATKLVFLVIYRFMNESVKVSTRIEHDQLTYSLLPNISEKKYQREYLYFIEFMLNIGRILGMLLIALVYVLTKNVKYLSYLFIVCTFFYLIYILNINKLLNINKDSNIENHL